MNPSIPPPNTREKQAFFIESSRLELKRRWRGWNIRRCRSRPRGIPWNHQASTNCSHSRKKWVCAGCEVSSARRRANAISANPRSSLALRVLAPRSRISGFPCPTSPDTWPKDYRRSQRHRLQYQHRRRPCRLRSRPNLLDNRKSSLKAACVGRLDSPPTSEMHRRSLESGFE